MVPLDEEYLTWLYTQVFDPAEEKSTHTYWWLFKTFYSTEFISLVPNDDNRIMDGLDVRQEFLDEYGPTDEEWPALDCSALEMMIALARRCSFEDGNDESYWVQEFIRNLGLAECSDAWEQSAKKRDRYSVTSIVEDFVSRRYHWSGLGGLFPMRNPKTDQRKVELWYQMAEYLNENDS